MTDDLKAKIKDALLKSMEEKYGVILPVVPNDDMAAMLSEAAYTAIEASGNVVVRVSAIDKAISALSFYANLENHKPEGRTVDNANAVTYDNGNMARLALPELQARPQAEEYKAFADKPDEDQEGTVTVSNPEKLIEAGG